MVTLVPGGYGHAGLNNDWYDSPWPECDSLERPVERMIKSLQENRILTNILIRPTASHVRQCAEITERITFTLTQAGTSQAADPEEKGRVFHDEMAGAAKTASRLNMGVSLGRGVDYRNGGGSGVYCRGGGNGGGLCRGRAGDDHRVRAGRPRPGRHHPPRAQAPRQTGKLLDWTAPSPRYSKGTAPFTNVLSFLVFLAVTLARRSPCLPYHTGCGFHLPKNIERLAPD